MHDNWKPKVIKYVTKVLNLSKMVVISICLALLWRDSDLAGLRGLLKTLKWEQSLREKCPNTEYFLVRISPHWDPACGVPLRIQSESAEMRTKKNSVFRHFSRSEFWIKNWFLIWGIFGIFDSYTDLYGLLFSLIFIFPARAPSLQAIMVFTYFPTKSSNLKTFLF